MIPNKAMHLLYEFRLFKKGVEGPNMYDVAGGQPVQDDVRVLKDEVRDMPEA